MCGICGFIDPRGDGSSSVLKRMTAALTHRGPDEEGFLTEAAWAFGHRRLRVIDLDSGGQPMTGADGRVSVVFNGEIYNFRAIRSDLEKKGRVFRTRSDTESLLQLYEEEGIACLEKLEGMFAAAIYDRDLRKLFLAVDPFGKKPLFYHQSPGRFVFSSEIRSLLLHPAVSKAVDPDALARYLAFEYVPAPETIVAGVKKLRGGTFLETDGTVVRINTYRPAGKDVHPGEEKAWPEVLIDLVKKAVRARLVSDVPLGVFLSGGLDSGSIVALMREMEPGRTIKTFTIGFREPSFDESRFAKLVSDRFATEHVTEVFSVSQMRDEYPDILSQLDEPLADASFLPTFMLCRLARRHVTVALSGDGGDELFMGYPTFQAEVLARRLGLLPGAVARLAAALAAALPVSTRNLSPDFLAKQFFKGYFYPEVRRRQVWLGGFSDAEAERVLAPPFRSRAANVFDVLPASEGTLLDRARDFYFKFYLEGDILVKADRASMANSLEVRAPLLDDTLVRVMRRIPAARHMLRGELKSLFKKALRGRLPAEILNRRKKGFGIPIAQWIREDLRGEFTAAFQRRKVAREGFFDADEVDRILKEHLSGKKDNRKKLWTLYVFQKWRERCL